MLECSDKIRSAFCLSQSEWSLSPMAPTLIQHAESANYHRRVEHTSKTSPTDAHQRPDVGWWPTISLVYLGPYMKNWASRRPAVWRSAITKYLKTFHLMHWQLQYVSWMGSCISIYSTLLSRCLTVFSPSIFLIPLSLSWDEELLDVLLCCSWEVKTE